MRKLTMLLYSLQEAIMLLCLLLMPLTPSSGQSQRPNIIYIMTDDMGYGDLSGYGRKEYQTPNLDKLASQGTKFLQAYSAGSVCTPTRAAFMTGRYPARIPIGLFEPLTPAIRDSAFGLTSEYPSVALLMQSGGYETALIGKWHLGFLSQHSPTKNGFDYFFGIHSGAADYISHKGDARSPDLYENDVPVSEEGYLTELFSRKAVSFIQQKHTKPFLLVITYNAPHWPWQGPDDLPYADSANFRDGGSPATYAAMMKSLDDGIGSIMEILDNEHLTENTMVIFTNDNGGERFSDNGGFTNSKGSLWEGGIRVPAFIRWPGKIQPGIQSQQVAVTMDWTATILSAGGVKPQKDFPLDGIDLMPILTAKEKAVERTIYWRTFQRTKQKAVRMGEWKYLQDEKGEYLFNLVADPGEKNNLKENHQSVFNQLKTKYSNWEKTVLQPIPL